MNFKSALPHLLACIFFFSITLVLFYSGIVDGKVLNQHDILQWHGGAHETLDYRKQSGEEALWSNSMFSGMPTTLISTQYYGDVMVHIQRIISLGIPRPFSFIFLAFVSFYILMTAFGVRMEIGVLSAICFGASSFLIIGVMAGHTSRIAAIAFLPLVVAGVKFIFDQKYSWGFILTAIGLALEIRVNHLQITYYLAIILVVFGLNHLIICLRNRTAEQLKFQLPILLLAAALAVGANYGILSSVFEYSKHSTRGQSELSNREQGNTGLEKAYVFEFSNGITEPIVLFIPNFYGGSSNESLSDKSVLAKALSTQGMSRFQVDQYLQSVPTYWGNQRLTAPYYVGAIMIFLFVLGLLILDLKSNIWLVVTVVLGIVLSWGDNFQALNYFLFDFMPGYSKFRSVTFTLILAIFGITAIAGLAFQKIVEFPPKKAGKKIIQTAVIVGGFAVIAGLLAGIGSFRAPIDEQLIAVQRPDWFIDAIRGDRERMLRMDALRSAFFVFAAGAIIWLIVKERVQKGTGLIIIIILGTADIVMVDKRYLNKDKFEYDVTEKYFKPQDADKFIQEITTAGDRVLNLQNPFNEALTSYHHNSIGGYHGAKLGRYQELIEASISPEINALIQDLQAGGDNKSFEKAGVINMLNARFVKYGPAKENVLINDMANGSAWFVSDVLMVNSADEELKTLAEINTKTHAVIDGNKFSIPVVSTDSLAEISLEVKEVKKIKYSTSSKSEGFAVFSEIYYSEGWTATIDGKPTEIFRTNYLLRGLQVPAGKHEIEFRFEVENFRFLNNVSLASGLAIFVTSFGFFFTSYRKRKS